VDTKECGILITLLSLSLTIVLMIFSTDTAKADSVIATIPVGSSAQGIAIDSTHNKLYVVNFGSNDVAIIDYYVTFQATTILPIAQNVSFFLSACC
jgi:DNA-binding beta-propeller fold protein YncE